MEKDTAAINQENHYTIRPNFRKKFRSTVVKELIHKVLTEKLGDVTYHPENVPQWTKDIANELKEQLKGLELDRYKYVVQVVIGEQKGEGARMGCRCFWDSDTDSFAQDVFLSDSLFCVAAVFGIYYY